MYKKNIKTKYKFSTSDSNVHIIRPLLLPASNFPLLTWFNKSWADMRHVVKQMSDMEILLLEK